MFFQAFEHLPSHWELVAAWSWGELTLELPVLGGRRGRKGTPTVVVTAVPPPS